MKVRQNGRRSRGDCPGRRQQRRPARRSQHGHGAVRGRDVLDGVPASTGPSCIERLNCEIKRRTDWPASSPMDAIIRLIGATGSCDISTSDEMAFQMLSAYGAAATPGALIRNWIGGREHLGLESEPCHFRVQTTIRRRSESGSFPESICGTGCSTVGTPARFKYQFVDFPGMAAVGLEPRCGLSLERTSFFVEPYLAKQCFGRRVCEHPSDRGEYVGARAGGARRAIIGAFRLHGDRWKPPRALEGAGPGIGRANH